MRRTEAHYTYLQSNLSKCESIFSVAPQCEQLCLSSTSVHQVSGSHKEHPTQTSHLCISQQGLHSHEKLMLPEI